jgi:hypothetical protein
MSFTEPPVYSYNRGHLWMGDAIAGGMPSSFPVDIAAIDTFEVTLTPEYVEHMNKQSSVALKDVKALSGMSASGKITCSQRHLALLTKWLYASNTTIAGGAFSATAFVKNPAIVGDILNVPGNKTKITSLVITDSAGSPVTGTLGTDYEADPDAGVIKILTLANLTTQPLKAAGTEGAVTGVNFFQSPPALQGIRFMGINILNSNAVEIVDLPKVQFSPAGAWQMIGDGNENAKFEWDFEILSDTSNLVYPFGRIKVAS